LKLLPNVELREVRANVNDPVGGELDAHVGLATDAILREATVAIVTDQVEVEDGLASWAKDRHTHRTFLWKATPTARVECVPMHGCTETFDAELRHEELYWTSLWSWSLHWSSRR